MSHAATPSDTPNVVVSNPTARKVIGAALYTLALLSGIASIVLGFWPELASIEPDPSRVIATVNAIVSLLAGAFGFVVTIPNVPKG
jgi:hypothetical protein